MKHYRAFAFSTRGADHIRRGVVCQDAVGMYEDDAMAIAVVSDGHGSPQYFRSDRGAKFAVQCAIACLREFLEALLSDAAARERMTRSVEARDTMMRDLERSILVRWHGCVDRDMDAEPFDEETLSALPQKYQDRYRGDGYAHAYGATLIALAATEAFWFALQIGDGICVTVGPDQDIREPLPLDPLCHENVTTSICQADALQRFHYCFDVQLPIAAYAASDGVDDSYEDDEMLCQVYRGITVVFGKGFDHGAAQVRDFLPLITTRGKGDDTSMIGIIDMERVGACAEAFRKQIDAEKVERAEKAVAVAEAPETEPETAEQDTSEEAEAAQSEEPETVGEAAQPQEQAKEAPQDDPEEDVAPARSAEPALQPDGE